MYVCRHMVYVGSNGDLGCGISAVIPSWITYECSKLLETAQTPKLNPCSILLLEHIETRSWYSRELASEYMTGLF